jgi:SM-20-related protein
MSYTTNHQEIKSNSSSIIEEHQIDPLISDLVDQGWSAQSNFFPHEWCSQLVSIEQRLWNEHTFREARIGSGNQEQSNSEIRTDRIHWIDSALIEQYPLIADYFTTIDYLRQILNRSLFLSLQTFEAHLAVYPAGSFYKRHLDQFQAGQDRLITCIVYLNSHWTVDDGGLLRIYTNPHRDSEHVDVVPKMGTFVCFRSDLIPHEVLPAHDQRLSITGWLRREQYTGIG